MHCTNALMVALTAFTIESAALAIPAIDTQANSGNIQADTASLLKDYQSSLFGWQLAGAAISDDGVNAICNGINSIVPNGGGDYSTWAEQGLDVGSIKDVVCNPTKPDANTTLPNIRNLTTTIYNTLIQGSFDLSDNTVSSYLCNNLDHALLGSFNISDNVIIDNVCTSAGAAPLPAPIGSAGGAGNVADAFIAARSKLYATQYASAAVSDSVLNQWCAHSPDAISNLDSLDLDGNVVQDTLCGFEKPPCYVEADEASLEWNSEMFAILIQNASGSEGYGEWLCQNLKPDLMDSLGLNGTMVSQEVCG